MTQRSHSSIGITANVSIVGAHYSVGCLANWVWELIKQLFQQAAHVESDGVSFNLKSSAHHGSQRL